MEDPISQRIGCSGRIGRFFALYWRVLVLVTTPCLTALVFLLDSSPSHRCMFVVIIMAVYWITEALPLPITSLLPVVLFPLLGILETDRTCMMYMRETLLMFMGGIFLALAIEHCNLHKRIALKVICSIGCSQRKLNFGLLTVTMFVSMWISNTATVAMMCPIMKAVLEELESVFGVGSRLLGCLIYVIYFSKDCVKCISSPQLTVVRKISKATSNL